MGKKVQKYNRKQIEAGELKQSQVDYLLELGVREYQKSKNNLLVDGMVGPKTIKELTNIEKVSKDKVPTGKGIYVRRLDKVSPARLVKICELAGLDFVCILSIWQDRRHLRRYTWNYNSDNLQEYCHALHAAGIKIWLWGYPYPGRESQFIDHIAHDVDLVYSKLEGVIVDPEKPYKGKPEKAVKLMTKLRVCFGAKNRPSLSLGFTSYAATWFHKTLPYKRFAKLADFGSPQVYDNQNNLGHRYAEQAVNAYLKKGFKEVVVSTPAYNKTAEQLNKLLESIPDCVDGIIIWDLDNLLINDHLIATYRQFSL